MEIKLGIMVVCKSGAGTPIGEPNFRLWTSDRYQRVKAVLSRAFLKPSAIYRVGTFSHSAASALNHSMEGSGTEGAVVGIMTQPCLRAATIEVETKA